MSHLPFLSSRFPRGLDITVVFISKGNMNMLILPELHVAHITQKVYHFPVCYRRCIYSTW